MPLIKRSDISKRTDYHTMKGHLDLLLETPVDSPIIKRAIRDIKDYVVKHLLADWFSIDENILEVRIAECENFIATINNARQQGWKEGKESIERYYEATKKNIKKGHLMSYLESTLSATYDALSGNFSMRHSRMEKSLTSIDDPLVAYHYLELLRIFERVKETYDTQVANTLDYKVRQTMDLIVNYLKTIKGEELRQFKDNFGVSSKVLQQRFAKLTELVLIVEKYLNAPEEGNYNPAFLCPLSYDVMSDPVMVVTNQEPFHTYERVHIEAHFAHQKKMGAILTDPITGLNATGQLIANFSLKQALTQETETNLDKNYFLMRLELALKSVSKKGIWGSNLSDLCELAVAPPPTQEMNSVPGPA